MKMLATALAAALVLSGAAHAQPKPAEKPQYGGALSVANVYYTISPLTFDSADMAWKMNQDTGLVYEQLFVADLSKAKSKGGKYLGVTITVKATSREQLDELYRTLSTHPMVKVVL